MEAVNAKKEIFEVIELFGFFGLYSPNRIDPDTVTDDLNIYELQGKDNKITAVHQRWPDNDFAGTIITRDHIILNHKGSKPVKSRDIAMLGLKRAMHEYRINP